MLARLKKALESLAYLWLIFLSWKWFAGQLDFNFNLSCVLLSLAWLGLTAHGLSENLRTYFDILSRLKVRVPMIFGILLSSLVLFTPWQPEVTLARLFNPSELLAHILSPLPLLAAVELALWLLVYGAYKRNALRFKKQGHGPLPRGAWVNPPKEALQEGDMILTSGRIAKTLRESVGHGEVVVDLKRGELYTLTSYMEKGVLIQPLAQMTEKLTHGHYIGLRLGKGFDEKQKSLVKGLTEIILEQNKLYQEEARLKRDKLYDFFHLPNFLRGWIEKKIPVSGYDWIGLFTGRRSQDRFTCVGVCLELYHRLGVKTSVYGTGLFGLGTGLFDPIMPTRFLADPAFRLLTVADKAKFEKSQN